MEKLGNSSYHISVRTWKAKPKLTFLGRFHLQFQSPPVAGRKVGGLCRWCYLNFVVSLLFLSIRKGDGFITRRAEKA